MVENNSFFAHQLQVPYLSALCFRFHDNAVDRILSRQPANTLHSLFYYTFHEVFFEYDLLYHEKITNNKYLLFYGFAFCILLKVNNMLSNIYYWYESTNITNSLFTNADKWWSAAWCVVNVFIFKSLLESIPLLLFSLYLIYAYMIVIW